jgi:hypothetical protein
VWACRFAEKMWLEAVAQLTRIVSRGQGNANSVIGERMAAARCEAVPFLRCSISMLNIAPTTGAL